ncbi:SbcC/MukB-like Walker B domain-containing protein [Methylotuvimicrobium buryatense]|uniref:Chromosome segregation protein SMC n=1 Tax=Methylotuvimicrobium buryatense TaxID=95641 RepID=A0A4P9US82_METBY|nr:SbcC/MukB-like Walker B domain-containing protein [Methylotuvimicrobium buryatense]QCW83221.1 chromosome segregation protein SMC [Methylotuvimicrobium buryatense]
MKILKIKFRNINSLEGDNQVDFREAPFSDSGLFAITGPNGSGKSSILDAITLGLYGETFRFDRPAVHVMTKRTAESFSEVDFAVGDNLYRATWKVQRERQDPNGRLQSPQMLLIKIEDDREQLLAETPNAVCQKIAEITGMNFRNFTRSIMLAQGDFAAFLNALDNERLDILEKIISSDIYADYKNAVIAKADEEQALLASLKQDIDALDMLEPAKQEAFEHDLADFKDQISEFRGQRDELKQQQVWLQNIETLEKRIIALTQQQEKAQTQAEQTQQQLTRIAENPEALFFKEAADELEALEKEIEQGKQTLNAYRSELKRLQDKLALSGVAPESLGAAPTKSIEDQQRAIETQKARISQHTQEKHLETDVTRGLEIQREQKQSVLATVDEWLELNARDENLLENFPETAKLKKLRAELASLTEQHKRSAKSVQATGASLSGHQARIQKSQKTIGRLKLKLQINEQKLEGVALGRDAAEIDELLKDQKERLADFQSLYNLSREHARLTGGRFSFFGFGKAKEEKTLDDLQAELAQYKDDIMREDNIRLTLEKAVANETILARLADERVHLEDGKPCPLCGALNHPYVIRPPKIGDSKRALADQRAKIQALVAASERIEQEAKLTEKRLEGSKAKRQRIELLRSQWLTLCNRLNAVNDDMEINNSRAIKRFLKTETIELKNITKLAQEYRVQAKRIDKIKELMVRHEAMIGRLQENTKQLDQEWQSRPQELKELEQTLEKCRKDEQELTAKVLHQLDLVGEKMPGKGKEDAFYDRLNQRRQEYQTYQLRRKGLTDEIAAITEKIDVSNRKIAQLSEKIAAAGTQLQQEETAGLHLALIEKQKLIADKEKLIGQQTAEAARMREVFRERLVGTKYESWRVDEVIELLHLIARGTELEQRMSVLQSELADLATRLENTQAEIAAEQALALTTQTVEDIVLRIRGIDEKIDISRQEAARLEAMLGKNLAMRQQFDVLSTKLTAQQEIVDECLLEVKRIDEENGAVFRRRVQIKMADKLLAQANQVLEKISGRYYLRQMPSEHGLALEIEDTYQNNIRRLPKSLSGGESFVVSLALALGLSELAGNGRSVDSLFLDEGFGTLDAETLYVVISTLESLQKHGKKVGVISHVEAVQKRIKAQLQMVKKPNGMSILKSVPDQEVAF